jgi:phosphoribosylglycinamide formyltransferase-1
VKKLCVFASGAGSNAENIIRYFREKGTAEVALVVVNKPNAGVISKAEQLGVEVLLTGRDYFTDPHGLTRTLTQKGVDWIILAGFLWLIPSCLIHAFEGKIINIHPSLLPKFGGKGMYGDKVHRAVIDAREKESGITIHLVDEHYDRGGILLQERCAVEPGETPHSLATKIHLLEHRFYPELIESLIGNKG